MNVLRDHGGNLHEAAARFGGAPEDWLDLSTGLNPHPYPVKALPGAVWERLPERMEMEALIGAARSFWKVPAEAAVIAAPGASALIARLPGAISGSRVNIPGPTYNEHEAAFRAEGWSVASDNADACVLVNPNNPTGRVWKKEDLTGRCNIIDESFCDPTPEWSLIHVAARPGTVILKSFGKFWGLGGLRLGFAIGDPVLIGRLSDLLGPWPVSGPALAIGLAALGDFGWAEETRQRLKHDAERLDGLFRNKGAQPLGGTSLFRLYGVDDALKWQSALATRHIWTRVFPYSRHWLRVGVPPLAAWERLEAAL